MFCNPGEASVARAAVALRRFWLKAASQVHLTKKPWMASVKVFLDALNMPLNRVCDRAVDPLVLCPLPRWITKWAPLEGSEASHGYPIPDGTTIASSSACVNVWSRQWPAHLQQQVIMWARALLQQRCSSQPTRFVSKDTFWRQRNMMRQCLSRCESFLLAIYIDCNLVHRVLADSHLALGLRGAHDILRLTVKASSAELCVCVWSWLLRPSIVSVTWRPKLHAFLSFLGALAQTQRKRMRSCRR